MTLTQCTAVVGIIATLTGVVIAGDRWIEEKRERDQRTSAQILEQIQQDVQRNNQHRIEVETRERLKREGWTPPPEWEDDER